MTYEKVNRKALTEALEQGGIIVYDLKQHRDNTWSLDGRTENEDGRHYVRLADVQRAISRWDMVAYKATLTSALTLHFGLRAAEPLAAGVWRDISKIVNWLTCYREETLVNRHILVKPGDYTLKSDPLGSGLDVDVDGIKGVCLYEFDDGSFYFLPDNPHIQYLHPVGPTASQEVSVEDAARLLDADGGQGAIRMMCWSARVWAISSDMQWMLVEEGGEFAIVEAVHGLVVEAVPAAKRPPMRVEYRLRMDYRSRPEVSAEIYPDAERWSSISVSSRSQEASINWYATSGSIEVATAFHAAYGLALEIARKLEALIL